VAWPLCPQPSLSNPRLGAPSAAQTLHPRQASPAAPFPLSPCYTEQLSPCLSDSPLLSPTSAHPGHPGPNLAPLDSALVGCPSHANLPLISPGSTRSAVMFVLVLGQWLASTGYSERTGGAESQSFPEHGLWVGLPL
jgi:hypothetical protein